MQNTGTAEFGAAHFLSLTHSLGPAGVLFALGQPNPAGWAVLLGGAIATAMNVATVVLPSEGAALVTSSVRYG